MHAAWGSKTVGPECERISCPAVAVPCPVPRAVPSVPRSFLDQTTCPIPVSRPSVPSGLIRPKSLVQSNTSFRALASPTLDLGLRTWNPSLPAGVACRGSLLLPIEKRSPSPADLFSVPGGVLFYPCVPRPLRPMPQERPRQFARVIFDQTTCPVPPGACPWTRCGWTGLSIPCCLPRARKSSTADIVLTKS